MIINYINKIGPAREFCIPSLTILPPHETPYLNLTIAIDKNQLAWISLI